MSSFTLIVIMGVLMIIGGFSLLSTPLINVMAAGYFIIILFLLSGITGLIQGIREKRFDRNFFFAVLSLILGIAGLAIPGAAEMSNVVLLYMAAGWFCLHGILTIIAAVRSRSEGAGVGAMILGIILGVLELILSVYSALHPAVLVLSVGFLIAFYFIESGINLISTGMAVCDGANSGTVLFTFLGILTVIAGISMLATPLLNFLGAGHCIIILFLIFGVVGIVRAIADKQYDRHFFFAILSLILGIIGLAVPGMAEMNNSILLYMAAGWLLIRGVLSIVTAIQSKKQGAGTGLMILGIVLGVLELILGAYAIAHPAVAAVTLGFLISFFFILSGIRMIVTGSAFARVASLVRTGTTYNA